jgi:hypothetical protein
MLGLIFSHLTNFHVFDGDKFFTYVNINKLTEVVKSLLIIVLIGFC